MSSFNWLHLSDLHWGQTGGRQHLWPEILHRFFEDLDKLVAQSGPWHAVLFSGDLVQRGDQEEFHHLERDVLGPLWEKFAKLGCNPVLLTVPGNHDLQRPDNALDKSLKPALQWLLTPERFPEIADEYYGDPDSHYRKIIDSTFANYTKWAAGQSHRNDHPILLSSFPGDFSTSLTLPDGHSVGVLGLNTTFLQLAPGDYQGKLAWDVRQFHAVCRGNGPNWASQHNVCLLMTHQGPEWLSEPARTRIYAEINPAGRFAVHHFGHMHAENISGRTHAGGPLQRLWQGTSFFGLEHYGDQGSEDRRHGYSACSLTFTGSQATLQHWPRKALWDEFNGWRFVPDHEGCILTKDEATQPEIIHLQTQPASDSVSNPGLDDSPTSGAHDDQKPRPIQDKTRASLSSTPGSASDLSIAKPNSSHRPRLLLTLKCLAMATCVIFFLLIWAFISGKRANQSGVQGVAIRELDAQDTDASKVDILEPSDGASVMYEATTAAYIVYVRIGSRHLQPDECILLTTVADDHIERPQFLTSPASEDKQGSIWEGQVHVGNKRLGIVPQTGESYTLNAYVLSKGEYEKTTEPSDATRRDSLPDDFKGKPLHTSTFTISDEGSRE